MGSCAACLQWLKRGGGGRRVAAAEAPGRALGPADLDRLSNALESARKARLLELGVSAQAIARSTLVPLREKGGDGLVRCMQFNVLADAMSDDGFLVPPVLSDWPAGAGEVPTASGSSVPLAHLFQEMFAAQGDAAALGELKAKYDVEAARKNLAAVVDWSARELQIQLLVLAARRPDVIVLQELDHFAGLAAALAKLGYASQLPGRACPYRPGHLDGHETRSEEGRRRFQASFQQAGHAFLPALGSTAMSILLRRRGLADRVVAAAEAAGLGPNIADPEKGGLAAKAFAGLPGGSEPLLRAAGLEDPASIDDDGVAIFWRADTFEAEGLAAHLHPNGKGGALEVRLRSKATGRLLVVMGAHLSSGSHPSDEQKRLESEVDPAHGLAAWARSAIGLLDRSRHEAFLLALDANSFPQLAAPDGTASVWRSLRGAIGASVWDSFFAPDGAPCGNGPPPVTTNKVRGPCSDQAKKIGEHACYCIDHVFFDPQGLSLQRHAIGPERFASQDAALGTVLPSLANPSDHYPVVVDLRWSGA